MQVGGRLDLDDDCIVHDEVQTLPAERLAFVQHLNRYLALDPMTAVDQLSLQGFRAQWLQETETEPFVGLVEATDDREYPFLLHEPAFVPSLLLFHPQGLGSFG